MKWYLYILRCSDNSLYTGTTTDLRRRVNEHNNDNKLGARSIRGKRPVKLVYWEKFEIQAVAAKRESAIKKWTRKCKLKLIEGFNPSKSP